MRRVVAVLITILVVVGGIGFYRGWFVMSNSHQSGNNKVDVNLTVDPDKVKSDIKDATRFK